MTAPDLTSSGVGRPNGVAGFEQHLEVEPVAHPAG